MVVSTHRLVDLFCLELPIPLVGFPSGYAFGLMVAYHWQRLGILGALSPLSWEKVSGFGEAEARTWGSYWSWMQWLNQLNVISDVNSSMFASDMNVLHANLFGLQILYLSIIQPCTGHSSDIADGWSRPQLGYWTFRRLFQAPITFSSHCYLHLWPAYPPWN